MESRTTTQTVTYYNRIRKLTRIESMLLKKLLENRGRVITIGTLEQNLYGERCDKIHSNALAVHTHNLRRKFPELKIKPIRGVGYVLENSTEITETNFNYTLFYHREVEIKYS